MVFLQNVYGGLSVWYAAPKRENYSIEFRESCSKHIDSVMYLRTDGLDARLERQISGAAKQGEKSHF